MNIKEIFNILSQAQKEQIKNDLKDVKRIFQMPTPVYSNEVEKQSKEILVDRHISINHDKTRKAKRQIVLPRPFLRSHKNCNDGFCQVCADFINRLDEWYRANKK